MAITLITGLPGNAKTIHTLDLVIAQAKAENRPVYYAGIKGLLVDDPRLEGTTWLPFNPEKWHEELPSGAIAVIDEAQKVFRARTLGTVPPKHVTELEEHRHKGLDFFMVTQHPSLIDPAIRKLTQTHKHMVRVWGMEASTVHRWDGVRDNCDKPAARKDSEKTKWGFNKKLYGLYHSADQHTMKRHIPGRVKMLAVLAVLFVCAVGFMARFIYNKTHPEALATAAQGQGAATGGQIPGQLGPQMVAAAAVPRDPMQEARDYVEQQTPRVVGLPHTAPKYDQLTEPTSVPVPAACIQIGSSQGKKAPRCKCYTQRGTPMDVEYNMCIEIAHNGYFLDFDPNGREARREQAARAEHSAQLVPDRGNVAGSRGAGVAVASFDRVADERGHYRISGSSIEY
jgi:zona occludens toxin